MKLVFSFLFPSLWSSVYFIFLSSSCSFLTIKIMSPIKDFQHLIIPLGDIKSATNEFGAEKCIGEGGFGKVYKGELLLKDGLTVVAMKRLKSSFGQGIPEFWREIMLLSRYKHENLVTLLGFCNEGGENILVYEYLSNRSLDLYIRSADLSWDQRLRICIGAAYGLQYLHDPQEGSQQRVLHRDIKSGNILLDENWKVKIADFGLSKYGPANQQFTFLYTNAVGTMGYCDPLYVQTGFLTKESDVYSFGAVLFEVLCGRHCVQNYEDNRRFLTVLARKCYEEKTLDTIISNSLKDQISPQCLEWFSKIAYKCLQIERTARPLVGEIVTSLETALQYQEEYEFEKKKEMMRHVVSEPDSDEYWDTKLPRDWEIISKKFNIPVATSKKELFTLLYKGLPFDKKSKFFSINNSGKKCEYISAKKFLDYERYVYPSWVLEYDSRFHSKIKAAKYSYRACHKIKCEIKTSMLSLVTMYEVNLVFKYPEEPKTEHEKLMRIRWKTKELSVHSIHHAQRIKDEYWYKITMWRFINYEPNAEFDIVIEELSDYRHPQKSPLIIQGIEFRPIEMMKLEDDIKGLKSLSIEDGADDDEYWEKKLPYEYRRYSEISDKPLDSTNKKKLYLRFCEGFLADEGQLWFSLCKSTGGMCFMLSAKDILRHDSNYGRLVTLSLSKRFGEVKKLFYENQFNLKFRLRQWMFSPHCIYACYLVFKFEDHNRPEEFCLFRIRRMLDDISQGTMCAYFVSSRENIPTIKPKNDIGLHDSSYIPRNYGLRMLDHSEPSTSSRIIARKDGWMEVMMCEPAHYSEDVMSLYLLRSNSDNFTGMIIEGIEFRPFC